MSPYLLLGFFLAGLMHVFIPKALYSKYLSSNGIRSVIYAALLGIPLPLCSCGVIPTAMSLRKEGASKGATVSFLIATPQTGVDSIAATFSLMGLPFALIRPFVALFTALFGGLLVDKLDKEQPSVDTNNSASVSTATTTSSANASQQMSFVDKIKAALRYGFVDMMQDIGKWLVIGLLIAGLITVMVPDDFFQFFAGNSIMSILFVLVFSIPMYLCATGSIPIAVALMLKGLTPGAALVLLMAGPASNAASILVIGKVLGKKSMVLYLTSIVIGAVGFGLLIDAFLPAEWFMVMGSCADGACAGHTSTDYLGGTCTIILAALLLNAFSLRWRGQKHHCCCHTEGCHNDNETTDGNCSCHKEDCSCHKEETTHHFRIEGMHCNHCKANVEKAIMGVEGVTEVEVSLQDKEAVIKGIFNAEDIIKNVTALGFTISEIH